MKCKLSKMEVIRALLLAEAVALFFFGIIALTKNNTAKIEAIEA